MKSESPYPAWAPDKPPKKNVANSQTKPTQDEDEDKDKDKEVSLKEVTETVVGDGAVSSDDEEQETKGRMLVGGQAGRGESPPREWHLCAAVSPRKSPKECDARAKQVKVKYERQGLPQRSPLRQARDAGVVRSFLSPATPSPLNPGCCCILHTSDTDCYAISPWAP